MLWPSMQGTDVFLSGLQFQFSFTMVLSLRFYLSNSLSRLINIQCWALELCEIFGSTPREDMRD